LLEEQNRLVQAQRRLLGDVSHELRSPLARMGVALELARDCAPKESPVLCSTDGDSTNSRAVSTLDDALNYIENEAGHLSEIIDQLLTLTRLEIGVQQLENHPVDLTALVYAVAADADFEARSRGRFVRVLDSDDCATQGALPLLRSAIENVLRNAVCYTAEGTTVEVTLKTATSSEQEPSTRNMAQITVRDYGPGVPAAELENIFRPFFRVVGARDRKSGGDGLGLAITQRAVHLHGGNVTAFNSPDGGLVVKIHLPMQKKVEFQR
jgi:signal transduction histidine kinase